MTISLSDAGKRFNRDWIFRHVNYQFSPGNSYAIIGPNGSGKSTLLQVLAGSMMLSEGRIECRTDQQGISNDELYKQIALCAPYLELIEEMTVREFLEFHQVFKPLLSGVTIEQVIGAVGLEKAVHKQIRYYSSGMKQRVKLAQCIFTSSPVVLLDEPCTNLDTAGIALYQGMIGKYCKERLVVVSSNDEVEYSFCRERIHMSDYK